MTPDEIRSWRVRMGLSQRAAAARLGVGQAYIWRLEHGQRSPSGTLVELMRAVERLEADDGA